MAVQLTTDQTVQPFLQNGNVIIKFFADWCGNCKLIAPKFRRLSDDEIFKSFSFLDINAEENPEIRKIAGVDNLPFFAIFKDGKFINGTATSKIEVVQQMLLDAQNNEI